MNEGLLGRIEREVLGWPGVWKKRDENGPGGIGVTGYRLGQRQIGHVHDDGHVDFRFPSEIRDGLVRSGRAIPHPAFPDSRTTASYQIRSAEDVPGALDLFRMGYERAEATERRKARDRTTRKILTVRTPKEVRMNIFSSSEIEYLGSGMLGRLATVGRDGTPHVAPVGMFSHNAVLGTIDVGGRDLTNTKKFRDVRRSGRAAIVVDDLASTDPWRPRGIEVRGRAEAVEEPKPVIRIHPERIVAWGIDTGGFQHNSRSVEPKGN